MEVRKATSIVVGVVLVLILLKVILALVARTWTAGIGLNRADSGLSISIVGAGLENVLIRANGAHEIRFDRLDSGEHTILAERIFGDDGVPVIRSVDLSADREGKRINMHFMFVDVGKTDDP